MVKRGRGRPRKIKKLEQYTISELRDMPMGPFVKLFFKDILGNRSVVISATQKPTSTPKEKKEKNQIVEEKVVVDLMGMSLEKKADYLADALMGYLKKAK
jgi:hypothetical protein